MHIVIIDLENYSNDYEYLMLYLIILFDKLSVAIISVCLISRGDAENHH